MTIGERIRFRRQQLGLSVRALSEKVGVSHGALSKWETNKTKGIPDTELKKLADRLDQLQTDRAIMRADLEKLNTGPVLSRDVIRQGLQLALLEDHVTDAAVIRIFVHQVVLHDDRLLIEYNFKGAGDALEKSELLEFDQNIEWWSIDKTGRTLTVFRGRVLVMCYWQ